MLYSANTGGFYLAEVHGGSIPPDAIEITDVAYNAMIAGQSAGQQIVPGPDGAPMLVSQFVDAAAILAAERATMRCSRFQARAALYNAGLLDDAELAISTAPALMKIAWADAQEFQRGSPTIAALAPALNLSATDIDDLFRAAMQITA